MAPLPALGAAVRGYGGHHEQLRFRGHRGPRAVRAPAAPGAGQEHHRPAPAVQAVQRGDAGSRRGLRPVRHGAGRRLPRPGHRARRIRGAAP